MTLVPHFAYPFALSGMSFATVEQDSDEEIGQNVYVIAATPVGSRVDEPDFGVEDHTFEQMGSSLSADDIADAVEQWEDRVSAEAVASIDGLTEQIELRYQQGVTE